MTMAPPSPLPLPMRVKAFLFQNKNEELTAHDVSVKFSTSHKNVHTQLARAVQSGELVRSRNDDGDYVYTLGNTGAAPQIPAVAKAPKERAKTVDIDLCTLPVSDDTPIPAARTDVSLHAHAALDRLTKPGQSIGIPLNASGKAAIRKAITDRHRARTHRYVVRTLENEFRVWLKAAPGAQP